MIKAILMYAMVAASIVTLLTMVGSCDNPYHQSIRETYRVG